MSTNNPATVRRDLDERRRDASLKIATAPDGLVRSRTNGDGGEPYALRLRLPFGYRVTVRRLIVPTRWFVDVQIGFRGRYISVERP